MAYYYGTCEVEEALAKIVEVVTRKVLEQADKGKVYLNVSDLSDDELAIKICAPNKYQ